MLKGLFHPGVHESAGESFPAMCVRGRVNERTVLAPGGPSGPVNWLQIPFYGTLKSDRWTN